MKIIRSNRKWKSTLSLLNNSILSWWKEVVSNTSLVLLYPLSFLLPHNRQIKKKRENIFLRIWHEIFFKEIKNSAIPSFSPDNFPSVTTYHASHFISLI